MKPPPPMLPASGHVTASAKATATAASTALPPERRALRPASDAGRETVTTMPLAPRADCWAGAPGTAASDRLSAPTTKKPLIRGSRLAACGFTFADSHLLLGHGLL